MDLNANAECRLVGALLVETLKPEEVAEIVQKDDFVNDFYGVIYNRIVVDSRVELQAIVEDLRAAGFEDCESKLAETMTSVSSFSDAKFCARRVKQDSIKRKSLGATQRAETGLRDPSSKATDVLDALRKEIDVIEQSSNPSDARRISEVALDVFAEIDGRATGTRNRGVKTGFKNVDELLYGLRPSELIIVAARPAMGKTAFAANIAENLTVDEGKTVLFVSLEMSSVELCTRLLAGRTSCSTSTIKNCEPCDFIARELTEAASEIQNAELYIDDSCRRTVASIAAEARRYKKSKGLDVLFVDYLGLVEPEDKKAPRQEQVAQMARQFKMLAKELEIPVVVLAQVNRAVESVGADKRPKLSNLRESGAIEQDADVVMFVHREEYYKKPEEVGGGERGMAEIIVAKHRNGPTGTAKLRWKSSQTKFVDFEDYVEDKKDNFYDEFSQFSGEEEAFDS